MKFQAGQKHITEKPIAISVLDNEGNDATVEYPKGEVFEILSASRNQNGEVSYEIEFWLDSGLMTYSFDEEVIQSFLEAN